MRQSTVLFGIVVLLSSPLLFAADPAVAIGAGRQALNARDYALAIENLQSAVPDAANLPEPKRTQALSAIHFYTALAFNGMDNEPKTRESLEYFFKLSPSMNTIDPQKFDPNFVTIFHQVRDARGREPGVTFTAIYPGYRTFSDEMPRERPLVQWIDGPEMTLLGTPAEKRAFKRLEDDVTRRLFIEDFWRRRDRTAGSEENEYRDEFLRRVAFADQTFVTETMRGSLTDRGRVFVLLGAPKLVRHLNLTAGEAARGIAPQKRGMPVASSVASRDVVANAKMAEVANRNMQASQADSTMVLKGKVERWVYSSEQLPRSFPDDQLVLKFITEEGYGENVLQREPLVVKALRDAGATPR